MPAANPPGSRIFVRFAQEQYDQFQDWSQRLGVPMTHLVAMCAWTGAHILIPRMLPDARTQLELIKEQEEMEQYEAQTEVLEDIHRQEREEFEQFSRHREEFQQWLQERSLHKDETGK